ncbi:MAG: hypothetical protein AB7P00_24615 [Sandaracinaceae bacterium]
MGNTLLERLDGAADAADAIERVARIDRGAALTLAAEIARRCLDVAPPRPGEAEPTARWDTLAASALASAEEAFELAARPLTGDRKKRLQELLVAAERHHDAIAEAADAYDYDPGCLSMNVVCAVIAMALGASDARGVVDRAVWLLGPNAGDRASFDSTVRDGLLGPVRAWERERAQRARAMLSWMRDALAR